MYSEAANIPIGNLANCPLCKHPCFRNEDFRTSRVLCICPACGKFIWNDMRDLFLNGLSIKEKAKVYKIQFALRSISENALGKRDNSFFPPYSNDDLKKLLDQKEPTVQEKLGLLLKHLGSITEHPGQTVEFDCKYDYPIVCARNAEEVMFYFDSLAEQEWLTSEPPFVNHTLPRFTVTANGWHELSRIGQLGVESSNAFIAMSFHPSRDPFETAISAAVRAAGYLPVRVDQVEHVNRIDDEILARIRSSKFLISDFSLQRNGVYFEAGFMLGLGRPVIWVCEKDDLKNVHFDARQYNTIDYLNEDDLRTRLQFRIEAILGRGPHRNEQTES